VSSSLLLSSASGDLGFMIKELVPMPFKFMGSTVWITTSHVCILIVLLILIGFAAACGHALKHPKEIPTGLQNVAELIVEMLSKMVNGTMGKSGDRFLCYFGTVFCFILVSNISGLLGLRPPTADYGTTFAMAIITFVLIHFNTIKYHNAKELWIDKCSPLPPWCPIWLPINLISDIAVPISLSLRLFANVLSGTIVMALVYGLLSKVAIIWPAVLHVYFDLFSGAIQTYVFCMLSMTYVTQAIDGRD